MDVENNGNGVPLDLQWENTVDNDSSVFLHELIQIIRKIDPTLAFFVVLGKNFLSQTPVVTFSKTVDLQFAYFQKKKMVVYSKQSLLAELKAIWETGCLPTQFLQDASSCTWVTAAGEYLIPNSK